MAATTRPHIAPDPTFRNPKRLADKNALFSYYAGYSAAFVEDALTFAELSGSSVVLDPWNGSATTTLAAGRRGHRTFGFDRNPAMVVLAQARHAGTQGRTNLQRLANRVVSTLGRTQVGVEPTDVLLRWFDAATTQRLRNAVATTTGRATPAFESLTPSSLQPARAALFVSLFRVVRHLLTPFRTSNPTWLRTKRTDETPVSLSETALAAAIEHEVNVVHARLVEPPTPATLSVADSTKLPLSDSTVDFVLTSPPYCTRLDYAVATLPDLAMLGCQTEAAFESFRTKLMGSTLTRPAPISDLSWPASIRSVLSDVAAHPSKASARYYLNYFNTYFLTLSRSLREVARVLKHTGKAALVVQDSYYKDIHVDLQQITTDLLRRDGLHLTQRQDFEVPAPLAAIHEYRASYGLGRRALESALFFSRGGQ